MAKDRYRFFRIEAEELLQGLTRGLLDLEAEPDPGTVATLLRLAHTLKGAARVVKLTEIGEIAHRMEDLLAHHRDSERTIPRDTLRELEELVDRARELVPRLEGDPARGDEPPGEPRSPAPDSVRVAVRELDELIEDVSEAQMAVSRVGAETDRVASVHARASELVRLMGDARAARAAAASAARALQDELSSLRRELDAGIEAAARELSHVRAGVDRARLIPAEDLFAELERAARDAAASEDKGVRIATSGAEVRLDAYVLTVLRRALVHVVRNAVAHGIESRDERTAQGKSPEGRLSLSMSRRGSRIHVVCEDDGRGVDEARVRRALVAAGRIPESEAAGLSRDDLLRQLVRGGVTTRPVATSTAGRGVGLDVVRDVAETLEGEVALRSRPGAGTSVELVAPVTLSSLPVLQLRSGSSAAAIPFAVVRTTLRVGEGDVVRTETAESVTVDGRAVPYVPLGDVLGSGHEDRVSAAVVVEAGGERGALGVESLGAVANVIVRRIPAVAAPAPVVAGAALDERGRPLVVLAPDALVRAALGRRAPPSPAPVRERAPVLVIDDSLTTRMLQQTILESAGYDVDLAVSGEEALAKARDGDYSLFIVDVEMPGMSGFEFIEATRRDPRLRDVPSIIVSSLGDPADRRRGKDAGARAYIAKGEFDQGGLVEAVRRLVG